MSLFVSVDKEKPDTDEVPIYIGQYNQNGIGCPKSMELDEYLRKYGLNQKMFFSNILETKKFSFGKHNKNGQ